MLVTLAADQLNASRDFGVRQSASLTPGSLHLLLAVSLDQAIQV